MEGEGQAYIGLVILDLTVPLMQTSLLFFHSWDKLWKGAKIFFLSLQYLRIWCIFYILCTTNCFKHRKYLYS